MVKIHPTAIVAPEARIGSGVEIGPFCIIGKDVEIGDNNIFVSGVVVDGHTIIGNSNRFFHSAVIGTAPQDLKYKDQPTRLIVGDNNTIREYVTINRSATLDEPTRVGNGNLLMTYAHVAHNCQIGNGIIIANAVNMAGHIHIEDFSTIGGMTAIHQFVTIGRYSFIGGASGVKKDIPPFTRGEGHPYKIAGLNSVGLQRRGFSLEDISAIKKIYKIFYRLSLNTTQAIEETEKIENPTNYQLEFINFVKNSSRGINRNNE